jgi:hypothetical protein
MTAPCVVSLIPAGTDKQTGPPGTRRPPVVSTYPAGTLTIIE